MTHRLPLFVRLPAVHCAVWIAALLVNPLLLGTVHAQGEQVHAEDKHVETQEHAIANPAAVRGAIILVVGTGGTDEYNTRFRDWANRWQAAGQAGRWDVTTIGQQETADTTDLQQLEALLKASATEAERPLWLVLIGHGTFDGRETKLNLRGPDLSHAQLGIWLQDMQRPLAILGLHAASGPLLEAATGPRRVIVTATKNAAEINFSHFGGFLIEALTDPTADLDKDQQVSLLEGFLRASRLTREFYAADGRLETEHPLFDDNGDQRGTRSENFRGVVPLASKDDHNPDGPRAHQWHLLPNLQERQLPPEVIQRRDELELQLVDLQSRKALLPEDVYYQQLELILVALAQLTLPDTLVE